MKLIQYLGHLTAAWFNVVNKCPSLKTIHEHVVQLRNFSLFFYNAKHGFIGLASAGASQKYVNISIAVYKLIIFLKNVLSLLVCVNFKSRR